MHKTAAASRAMQRQLRGQPVDVRPQWLVVWFRIGRDKQRRRRVYRMAKTYSRTRDAHAKYGDLVESGRAFCALLSRGRLFYWQGDPCLVREWTRTHRGVNKSASWRTASGYFERECGGRELALEADDAGKEDGGTDVAVHARLLWQ